MNKQRGFSLRVKRFHLLAFFLVPLFSRGDFFDQPLPDESTLHEPAYYEELIDRVLNYQSIDSVKLLDRALQTPQNKFEYAPLVASGKLDQPKKKAKTFSFEVRKDLRQDIAAKFMLVDIRKPDELYQQFEVGGKKLRDNPREIVNLSSPMLSFLYYNAYKTYSRASVDEELEAAVLSRFKEQNDKRKIELIDPGRTKILSNCDDNHTDLSVTLVGLNAIPSSRDETLDMTTHHFIFPKQSKLRRLFSLETDPKVLCEEKVKELKLALLKAAESNSLAVMRAEGDFLALEEFPRFAMGDFVESCQTKLKTAWNVVAAQVEAAIPLKEESGSEALERYREYLGVCRAETKSERKRIETETISISNKRVQAINDMSLRSHDDEWGRNYAQIVNDPQFRSPAQLDTNPSLVLSYKDYHPPKNESPEEKQARLEDEAENARLGELVRAEKAKEAEIDARFKREAELAYFKKLAEWNKQWLDGYNQGVLRVSAPEEFDAMMKSLAKRRFNDEQTFFSQPENKRILEAKNRIESRFPRGTPLSLPPVDRSIKVSFTPEEVRNMKIRREAEILALNARAKEHAAYIDGRPTIGFPSHLDENAQYDYMMKYLAELERITFDREYARLKKEATP